MSYFEVYSHYKNLSFEEMFSRVTDGQAEEAIGSGCEDPERLLALLSPAAEKHLEAMAQAAHAVTLRHFGRTIQLYTPLYLSNYCENECTYCGFNAENPIARKTLSLEEVEKEAQFIAASGLEHILVLTGDSRERSPLSYLRECLEILKRYFSSISLEIYALTEKEYATLVCDGVDGLTLYQETYDEAVYDRVHRSGPKKNYRFRLEAPERAARSGMRSVNVGALLGLHDWRRDIFFMALHAQYLQDRFPEVEIGASIPRLRPHSVDFRIASPVKNKDLAQIITALRLFLPRLGITVSTRESSVLRDGFLPLGVTRMSAGSTTEVGGHTLGTGPGSARSQFEIADPRGVEEIKGMLSARGYQPVLKDWMPL